MPDPRSALVSVDGNTVESLADECYRARVEMLRERASDYVTDTVYFPEKDEYLYWPARTEGYFEGFLEPTAGERTIIDRFETVGYEYLGCGAFRHAFGIPESELVLKIGRGAPNRRHFNGRWQNLSEATMADRSYVVPARYCAPDGVYAIYPSASPTLDRFEFAHTRLRDFSGMEEPRSVDGITVDGADVVAFRERLVKAGHDVVKPPGRIEVGNVGVYDGDLALLDVNQAATATVRGLPLTADPDAVVAAVDDARNRGEKRDVKPGGGLLEAVDATH